MTRIRNEKISRCSELAVEIKMMWSLQKVHIVLIILSSIGLIPKTLREDLAALNLNPEDAEGSHYRHLPHRSQIHPIKLLT